MEGLNSSIVKNLKLIVPKIDEQKEILKQISDKTKLLDEMEMIYRRKKLLLKEYIQSLTSLVVTGKIRITEDMI